MSCEYNDCISSSCKQCNQISTTPTPFVSAPSSPEKSTQLFTTNNAVSACARPESTTPSDFDFSVRTLEPGLPLLYPGSLNLMSTAEELFQNGQIKPLNARFSSCICCNHDGKSYDLSTLEGHTYDPSCPQCTACKGRSLSRNVEHRIPHASRRQGQAKLTSSESASGQWKKGVDGNIDKGSARHAHVHPHVGRVTQIPSLPLASYGKSRGGHHLHRRARSLSPLRVFHMDDMMIQPRPSFESELYTHMSSNTEPKFDGKPRRRRSSSSRKSWSLKELLNLGDNKVHHKRPHLSQDSTKLIRKDTSMPEKGEGSSTPSADGGLHSIKSSNEGGILSSSPWKLQKEQEADVDTTEKPKKRAFLSDKNGLLHCLGFTSKLSSVKGLHGTHFHAR